MEVTLQILHGRLKSGTGVPKVEGFTIRQPEFVIGGDADCNMVCRSRLVSQQHCKISLADTEVTLEDLNSEHGTFINGVRVQEITTLKTGDMLKIGRLEFFVSLTPPPTVPAPIVQPKATTAPLARDTVAMSASTSDTVVDTSRVKAPADGTESVDDLVSQMLTEADEQERELRRSDPAARYLKVESSAPSVKAAEVPAEEDPEEQRKRPPRKPPIKLPAEKLVQVPNITGKDSVNAAEQALDELLRVPRK